MPQEDILNLELSQIDCHHEMYPLCIWRFTQGRWPAKSVKISKTSKLQGLHTHQQPLDNLPGIQAPIHSDLQPPGICQHTYISRDQYFASRTVSIYSNRHFNSQIILRKPYFCTVFYVYLSHWKICIRLGLGNLWVFIQTKLILSLIKRLEYRFIPRFYSLAQGGEALLTSPGTGDCIGLSQVFSTYSRGRDLYGLLFFLFLLAHWGSILLTFLLSVGPSWLIAWNIVPWEYLFYTFKEIQYLVLVNIWRKKITMATGGQLTILNPNDQTNLDFLPISPIDGNTPVIENNDKRLTLDQALLKDVSSIIEILSRPNTTIAKKIWSIESYRKCQTY